MLKILNESEICKSGHFLWRFVDIHKFLNFVITQTLYLTRMDQLSDPMEGLSFSEMFNYSLRNHLVKNKFDGDDSLNTLFRNMKSNLSPENASEEYKSQFTQYVHCLFLGRSESMAMWELYSSSESVAIKFDPNWFCSSIKKSFENFEFPISIKEFILGRVVYRNIFGATLDGRIKVKHRGLRKDNSYSHEKEVRLLAKSVTNYPDVFGLNFKLVDIENGSFQIYSHPKLKEWQKENIKSILNKFMPQIDLIESSIRLKP